MQDVLTAKNCQSHETSLHVVRMQSYNNISTYMKHYGDIWQKNEEALFYIRHKFTTFAHINIIRK